MTGFLHIWTIWIEIHIKKLFWTVLTLEKFVRNISKVDVCDADALCTSFTPFILYFCASASGRCFIIYHANNNITAEIRNASPKVHPPSLLALHLWGEREGQITSWQPTFQRMWIMKRWYSCCCFYSFIRIDSELCILSKEQIVSVCWPSPCPGSGRSGAGRCWGGPPPARGPAPGTASTTRSGERTPRSPPS